MPATIAHIESGSSSATSPKRAKNNLVQRLMLRYKANRQAGKILKAVGEADQIHKGRKEGKSYDQFLGEL
jgi:hypothetical protein